MSVYGRNELDTIRRDFETLRSVESHPINPKLVLNLLETIDDCLDEPRRSVKEWFHDVANLIDDRIDRLEAAARYAEQASRATVPLHEVQKRISDALSEVREDIHSLPGWTGKEHDSVEQRNVLLAALIAAEEDLADVPGREDPPSLAAVRAAIKKAKGDT